MFRWVFCLLLLIAMRASSQSLFVPRDVAAAFDAKTRSPDGQPGPRYWQNRARYDIHIIAAPPDRMIRGSETIVYVNNSPDTLHALVFKLLLNVHKPGAPRDYVAYPNYLTDGVHVDSFRVNDGQMTFPDHPGLFTNATAGLPRPLLPHDSVRVSCNWHYQVSLQSGREGMIDSTTYFLAYFYPRVAVFDDVSGWDKMDFRDGHEFYSDFNDYSVTVTVPNNYLVWGTGTLQTSREVLQPAFLDRYDRSFHSDSTIHIVTTSDLALRHVTVQQPVNNWRFTATHIADMAFALSDHFVWDAASALVDSATHRRASVQSAYNDTAGDFRHMVSFGQHALNWFSNHWPGIPYPFEKSTIVQGYAGMEYPMMVNDETYADTSVSRLVAEHEIAHTYMPFYMGINETRYGFMDEGWATTFEYLIGELDMGAEKAAAAYKAFRIAGWINDPSSDEQVPIVQPGDAMLGPGFGNNEYGKASLGYLAMKDLLGDALFKKCLQEYMHRWNGKHPLPWDFFNTFNAIAGRDLNWFWNRWFFGTGYIDLGVGSITRTTGGYTVRLDNVGGFPAATDLNIDYSDGSSETRHLGPGIWEADAKTASITIRTRKKISAVHLSGGIFMDANPSNDMKQLGERK